MSSDHSAPTIAHHHHVDPALDLLNDLEEEEQQQQEPPPPITCEQTERDVLRSFSAFRSQHVLTFVFFSSPHRVMCPILSYTLVFGRM